MNKRWKGWLHCSMDQKKHSIRTCVALNAPDVVTELEKYTYTCINQTF